MPTMQRGELVEGRYELESILGKGGMGTVWVARDVRLGRPVAIKFLDDDGAGSEVQRARFAREARIASRIRNQHVVQVFGDGETSKGIPYVVMELLEGESLAARIARTRRCALEDTEAILQQVCRGLRSAHAQGLVHRDIKPANIFLTPQPDESVFVRLLDFGIAKEFGAASGITQSGDVLGTAYYMSPEQLRKPQSVGPATDIWALGVVMYEMLTGHLPFDAPAFPGLVVCIAEGKFCPPSKLCSDLPPALDECIANALQVQPSQRFASVDELIAAFSRVVRAHTSHALIKPDVARVLSQSADSTWPVPGRKRFLDLTTEILAFGAGAPRKLALAALALIALGIALRLGVLWLRPAPAAAPEKTVETTPSSVSMPEPKPEPSSVSMPEPQPEPEPEPQPEPRALMADDPPPIQALPKRRRALPKPIPAAPAPPPNLLDERRYGF